LVPNGLAFAMNCYYCGAANAPDELRCVRCGRRLQMANARPAPAGYRPAALALQPLPDPGLPKAAAPRQPKLFPPAAAPAPRVVPISGPQAAAAAPARAKQPAAKKAVPPANRQQQLAFGPVISPAATASRVEPVRFCQAPVAAPEHRAVAAFIDGGVILASWMTMAAIYTFWGGGQWTATPLALAAYATLGVGAAALYSLLWAFANGESAGLRAARLRILNFDGRPANRAERLARIASAWISIAPAGLGLVWALLDEESLTWHDQISKTFPTPIDAIR
jgi:uncharacterized RDD family membrane protein YckC